MAIRSHGGDYVVARLCVAFVVGAEAVGGNAAGIVVVGDNVVVVVRSLLLRLLQFPLQLLLSVCVLSIAPVCIGIVTSVVPRAFDIVVRVPVESASGIVLLMWALLLLLLPRWSLSVLVC